MLFVVKFLFSQASTIDEATEDINFEVSELQEHEIKLLDPAQTTLATCFFVGSMAFVILEMNFVSDQEFHHRFFKIVILYM